MVFLLDHQFQVSRFIPAMLSSSQKHQSPDFDYAEWKFISCHKRHFSSSLQSITFTLQIWECERFPRARKSLCSESERVITIKIFCIREEDDVLKQLHSNRSNFWIASLSLFCSENLNTSHKMLSSKNQLGFLFPNLWVLYLEIISN